MSDHDSKNDDWSSSDHLLPLPEPTPYNMVRIFARGVMLGAAAMLLDTFITNGLLGFENGYISYALLFSTIFMITGAFRDDSVSMIMSVILGIVVGILTLNLARVQVFDKPSLLAGIGL